MAFVDDFTLFWIFLKSSVQPFFHKLSQLATNQPFFTFKKATNASYKENL